tara:strand:+ start:151 stop:1665 length:1515 start_codon:yes stop_codon:yes gene_type:complete
MKKNITYLLITTLFLIGCSKDSDEDPAVPVGPEIEYYSLTVSTTTGGSVNSQGGTYEEGEEITITAIPEDGYLFQNWTGDENSSDNPLTIIMNDDINITANFFENYDYKVPSHYWKNEMNPFINLYGIAAQFGFHHHMGGFDTGTAYADFNMDGYLDILLQIGEVGDGIIMQNYMLINNGDGTYNLDNSLITNPNFETYQGRKAIVGDFNNDGRPDVVRPAGGHDWLRKSNILLSQNNGYYNFMEIENSPTSQFHTVSSGDIDNDGDLDLFFGGTIHDGFAINDGNGMFSWSPVYVSILNFELNDIDGQHGLYGVTTSEMIDFNQDGFIDLILGGGYKDNEDDPKLSGPTIFWGDGSGFFDYNNITEIWGFGEKPYINGELVDNNDDFVIKDIDGDGIYDVTLNYIRQIDNDPDNGGNTTMYYRYQIMRGIGSNEFEDVSDEWLPNYVKNCTVVWSLVKDIDNNGAIDLVQEAERVPRIGVDCYGDLLNSYRWEWNGSSFTQLN